MKIDDVMANASKYGGIPSEYDFILRNYLEQLIRHEVNVQGLLLYGSLARGRARPWQSDIDLIVLIKGPLFRTKERVQIKRQVTRSAYPGVQAVWMTVAELEAAYKGRAGHILDALHQGWILYDPFATLDILRKQLQEEINAGRFKRAKNHWVWPLDHLGEEIAL